MSVFLTFICVLCRDESWITLESRDRTCNGRRCIATCFGGPHPVPIQKVVRHFPPCLGLSIDFDNIESVDMQQLIDCGSLSIWQMVHERSIDVLNASTELSRKLNVAEEECSFWRAVARYYCQMYKDLNVALRVKKEEEERKLWIDIKKEGCYAKSASSKSVSTDSDMPSLEDVATYSEYTIASSASSQSIKQE
jgi:hypothetical protein